MTETPVATNGNSTRRFFGRRWANKAAVLASAAIAVILGSGVAYAYWTTTGSGAGAAAAGTASPLTIAAVSPAQALVPGGTSDVKLVITNPNKANVQVTALTLSNTGIAGYTDSTFSTSQSGCGTTGVTWASSGLKALGTPIVIAGNGGSYTLTLTGAASMDTTSDNGCQGATFKMPITGVTAQLTGATASTPTSGTQS